jgi:hypothetical protein
MRHSNAEEAVVMDDHSTSGPIENSALVTTHRTSAWVMNRHIIQSLGIASRKQEDIARVASQKHTAKTAVKDKKASLAHALAEKEAVGNNVASQLIQEQMENVLDMLLTKTAAAGRDNKEGDAMELDNGQGGLQISKDANVSSGMIRLYLIYCPYLFILISVLLYPLYILCHKETDKQSTKEAKQECIADVHSSVLSQFSSTSTLTLTLKSKTSLSTELEKMYVNLTLQIYKS